MRYTTIGLLLLFSFLSLELFAQQYLEFLNENNLSFQEKVERAEALFDKKGRGKHTGFKQFERWKYFAQRALDNRGFVITEEQMTSELEQFKRSHRTNQRSMNPQWIEMGPMQATNTSTWSSHIGRLSNVSIDVNNPNNLLVTSLGGGVWKSNDEGVTWIPLFDTESSMSMQSAFISPSNSNHFLVGGSGRIYRSIDGGSTWTIEASGVSTIYSIIVDPINPDYLLASSSNGRVYRSSDGGNSWTSTLVESGIRFYDVEFHPTNHNIVYASGRSGRLYKSTDKGVTWSRITSGPWATDGTIMLATSADGPDYLYIVKEKSGSFDGIYRSTNQGNTWTLMSDDSSNNNNLLGYNLTEKGGQAPRDMDIIVSPTNKDEVHVAGIMTFRSYDGGANWTQTTHWVISNSLPFVHADIDQMVYQGGKIYVASDGGLFISSDQASSFVDRTTGLGVRQFYRLSASSISQGRVAGGSQDNGTGIVKDNIWYDFVGADGMEPLIANENDDIVIGSIQYGRLYKSINGGISNTGVSQTESGNNGEWVTPLERDHTFQGVIYQGKKQLYRSTSMGGSWEQISNFDRGSDKIDEIAIAPGDHHTILVSFGSDLFLTQDEGETWVEITPTAYEKFINYMVIHPTDPNRFLIALNGGERIIETLDAGVTWSSKKFNLPNLGALSAIYDEVNPDKIYTSMSKGVYELDPSSNTWSLLGQGLPNTTANEIEIVNDTIYVATYGRGLWALPITGKGFTLNTNIKYGPCYDQGTVDTLDDGFSFILDPNGINLGTTYSLYIGADTITGIPYGSEYLVNNNGLGFPKDSVLSVTMVDDLNSNVSRVVKIHPLSGQECGYPAYCDLAIPITGSGLYSAPGPDRDQGGSQQGRNANWFIFTPMRDGLLSINSCDRGVDTRLYIHEGTCDSLTVVAANDDSCPMGPNRNNWASEVNNIVVFGHKTYFIEWDDRWSQQGFDFEVIFNGECFDYLHQDVTDLGVMDLRAVDGITVEGVIGGDLKVMTPGEITLRDATLLEGINVDVMMLNCSYDNENDYSVSRGNKLPLQDMDTTAVAFIYPDSLNSLVGEFGINVDVNHDDISELKIELVTPSGNRIVLFDRQCPGLKTLNFYLDRNAVNVPSCTAPWTKGQAVYDSNVLSQVEINAITSEQIKGEWRMEISDTAFGNTGIINSVMFYIRE